VAAVLMAGCAAVPTGGADVPAVALPATPDRWQTGDATAPADDRALVRWWSAFDDPALTQLVEQALQANPDLLAARAALAQARAQRDVTRAGNGISVEAGLRAQRAQTGSSAPGNAFRAELDASWEADLFGRQAAALEAGDAEVTASVANLGQARVSLAAEVAASYVEWWGYRERLRVARDNLTTQQEGLQLTEWRVQAGLASALELESARAAVEQTRAGLPALEASARQARFALAILTGRPPGADVPEPPDAGPTPPAVWTLPVPADALRQRPDVAAAEARLLAAAARVRQADAARRPSLTLGGTLSLAAPRVADLFDVAALTRSLVASLVAPVFDDGAGQAQVRVQQAAVEQARAALASTLLRALQDVENALVALSADRERLTHLQSAADAATHAERLASQRYAAGLIDYRSLLDAQRTRLAAQDTLAAARATWATNHVRLVKALGGGWSPADLAVGVMPAAQP